MVYLLKKIASTTIEATADRFAALRLITHLLQFNQVKYTWKNQTKNQKIERE